MLNKSYIKFSIILFFISLPIISKASSVDVNINIDVDSNGIKAGLNFPKSTDFIISQDKNTISAVFQNEISPIIDVMPQEAKEYLVSLNLSLDKKSIIFTMIDNNFEAVKTLADDGVMLSISKTIANSAKTYGDFKASIVPVRNPTKLTKETKDSKIESTGKKTDQQILTNIPKQIKTKTIREQNPVLEKVTDKLTDMLEISVDFLPDKSGRWSFYWKKKVAAAVFMREEYLWVVFNEKKYANLSAIRDSYKTTLVSADQIDNRGFTVLRFKIKGITNAKSYTAGNKWIIEVPPMGQVRSYTPTKVIAQYNTPFSKGIFFPADELADPILNITDPEVGDSISIVTSYRSDQGVDRKRSFVDFKLYNSAQGFALSFVSDSAYIQLIKTGLEIIVPSNHFAKSSDGFIEADTTKIIDASTEDKTKTILSLKKEEDVNFAVRKGELDNEIMQSTNHGKSDAYLKLAKFYFAHNLYYESAAVLKIVGRDPYALSFNKEIMVLLGISEFMKEHYVEAKTAFDSIDTTNLSQYEIAEVAFWQNMAKVQVTGVGDPVDFRSARANFIYGYPAKIQEVILEKDIEFSLATGDDLKKIKKLCLALEKKTQSKRIKDSMKYYQGVIARDSEDVDKALNIWQQLSINSNDSFNSTRARFAFVNLSNEKKIMTNDEAIVELSKLLMRWRGDEVEASILRKLGELYFNENKYEEALNTWKSLSENFSASGQSLFIASQMSNAFVEMFTSEQNHMSDLQAITMFYEFRELLPIGKIGDKIISYVIKKMINLDLLSRAASLLEHQIEYRFEGVDKVAAASELALVYILDKKPEAAIKVIDSTEMPNLDYDTKLTRNHLKAQAYIDLIQYDKALTLLRDDFTDTGNDIKSYIFLVENNWRDLKRVLTLTLEGRSEDIKPLTDKEKLNIEKLAIADYMLGDQEEIKFLLSRFGHFLEEGGPTISMLNFLSLDQGRIDYKDLNKNVPYEQMNDFISKYKQELLAPKVL